MLGETHRRIAREISRVLGLGEREASLLEVGSINPDFWENFPHHKRKEFEIAKNIAEARKLYLEKDDECYHKLGIALHYIQDRWTLRPKMHDKHTLWEMAITNSPIVDDSRLEKEIKETSLPTKVEKAYLNFLETINKSLTETQSEYWRYISEMRRFYLEKLRDVFLSQEPALAPKSYGEKLITFAWLEHPMGWSTPFLDLNFAYRVCLEVTCKVFSQEDAEKALRELRESKVQRLGRQEIHRKAFAATLDRFKKAEFQEILGALFE